MVLFSTRTQPQTDTPLSIESDAYSELFNGASFKYFKQHLNNVQRNMHYHFWTGGQWNMHDLLGYLLTVTGPADCWITTYAISEDSVRKLIYLQGNKLLQEVRCVFDLSAKENKTSAYLLAQSKFEVTLCPMHAKMLILTNDKWQVAVTGSANWTRNPKAERQLLCTVPEVVQQDIRILKGIFNNEPIFKVR